MLLAAFPADFDFTENRYFEPFTGGGALAFALSDHPTAPDRPSRRKSGRPVVLNDANGDLATTHQVIRDGVETLIAKLSLLAEATSEDRYYAVRAQRPTAPEDVAARFIFLNRLSFTGLWRVNSKGELEG